MTLKPSVAGGAFPVRPPSAARGATTAGITVPRGTALTRAEIAALMATDSTLWDEVAAHIDPRLQKASFKNG